jgi:hypothetical protein
MLNPMRTSQWGWKISKTKFPAIQGERKKNHAAYNREKKYHAKESAQKKNSTCKSTDVLHFNIVSTGLQDFAFLSRHICLKEQWTTSQGFYRLWNL